MTDLDRLSDSVERPDDEVRRSARDLLAASLTGRLGDLAVWLAGAQGTAPATAPRRTRLLLLADEVPARTAAVAAGTGVEVRVAGRRGGAAPRVDVEDACTTDEALADRKSVV